MNAPRLALAALLVLVASAAHAQDASPCTTPRKAVDLLLYWQQPAHADLSKAARCLDMSRAPSGERETRARQLKEVLDARGLFVDLDAIPADPDHENAAGLHRYELFPHRLDDVYLERVGKEWLWSARTVAEISTLHGDVFAVDLGGLEDRLPQWALSRVFGVGVWQLIALFLLVLVGLVMRALVMALAVRWAQRVLARLNAGVADAILDRVARPIGTLALAGVLALFIPVLKLPVRVAGVALLAVQVLAAFSLVWAAYRVIDVLTGWLEAKAERTRTKLDDQLVPLVRTSLKVFTVALGVIFVLQNLDIDVGSLLAGLGIGGLAFALAARDTVANLFGALTVFLDRPFQIGDWINVAGVEGIVEGVGFRSTRVRTFYNSLVTLPNGKIADTAVDNYGQRRYRRCTTTLGVTYDTDPEQLQAFVEGIRAIILANPTTRKEVFEVHFRDFGDSALEILVYFFFEVPSWSEELRQRHNVFLEILRLAKRLNVDFAFPTQTVHVESLAEAGRPPARQVPEDLAAAVRAFGPGGEASHPTDRELAGGFFPRSG